MDDSLIPPLHFMKENGMVNIDHLISLLGKSIEIQGTKLLDYFKTNIFDYDKFLTSEEYREQIKDILLNSNLNHIQNREKLVDIIYEILLDYFKKNIFDYDKFLKEEEIYETEIKDILLNHDLNDKKNRERLVLRISEIMGNKLEEIGNMERISRTDLEIVEHNFVYDSIPKLEKFMDEFNYPLNIKKLLEFKTNYNDETRDGAKIQKLRYTLQNLKIENGDNSRIPYDNMSKLSRYNKYKELLNRYREEYLNLLVKGNDDDEIRDFNELFQELYNEVNQHIDDIRNFFLGGQKKNVIRIRRIKKY